MALLAYELGPRPPEVVGRNPVLMEPPPRGAPAAAVALSRLEGAGVPVIERRIEPGEHVYLRGTPTGGCAS